ncbi:MAG: zinc D-Ala-D-Ala carboxypeptidase [Patescibacteria group bacterium]|nr:zinc D-Ala-D-Ala carboxypeptidase [Patescibacteria group bacterium]
MVSHKKSNKKQFVILISALIIGIALGVTLCAFKFNSLKITNIANNDISANTTEVAPVAEKVVAPSFDKTKFSTADPSSIWVVVNKQHPLSSVDFVPSDLITTNGATISSKAVDDFEAMLAAAATESITLTATSSYRSYDTQSKLYNGYIAEHGQAVADTFSAKPGYSEHQTGFAIDFTSIYEPICNFDDCFSDAIDGAWLTAHASDYGFILRYTAEKQSITGYKAESWHYRYIGRELATEMKKQSITTLEEFFNVTGGEIYL